MGMPNTGMSCGMSPVPSQVDPGGLHSAPTPRQMTPRPTHAIAVSRHCTSVFVPRSVSTSGKQSHVDGSPSTVLWHGCTQSGVESAAREHPHV